MVDTQSFDGRAGQRGVTDKDRAIPMEVVVQVVGTRVEESDDFAGLGIDTRDVWAFVGVTIIASAGEVCGIGWAARFFGDDVVDLERRFGEAFGKVAALAESFGASAD